MGFLVGKAAAIAEWHHKKEEEAYQALFERLAARNRQRRYWEEDPEGMAARQRRYRAENPEKVRIWRRRNRAKPEQKRRAEARRKRYRARKAAARLAATDPWPCRVCRHPIEPRAGSGRRRVYCSTRCKNRWQYWSPEQRQRHIEDHS